MAIDPVKKLTVISPLKISEHLMKAVSDLGVVHIIDAGEKLQDDSAHLRMKATSTEDVDEILHKIDSILNLLDMYAPESEGFFQGLAPVPQLIESEELDSVVKNYELDERYLYSEELEELAHRNERNRSETENKLAAITPFRNLSISFERFYNARRFTFLFGYLPSRNLTNFEIETDSWPNVAWEIVESIHQEEGTAQEMLSKDKVRAIVATFNEDAQDVRTALHKASFVEVEVPKFSGTVEDQARALEADLVELMSERDDILEKIRAFSSDRRSLITLKAFWAAHRNRHLAMSKTLGGRWVHLLNGYIRVRDIDRFKGALEKEFPDSTIFLEDPAPDENVPVSLSLPGPLRPLSLIVEMFGLPPYKSFDPTAFLHVNFYIFFGICFSDVGYGLMLIASSLYLIKRTKQHQGVADFGRILLYGGISTVIFGALMGSWFGDLYMEKYLGENNILMKIQSLFVVIDPISKIIPALLLTLLIGVLNQFYGIGLKMYGSAREGDWKGFFFDGFFWYLILPGILVLISRLFVETPPMLFRIGIVLFSGGALGLVLTQGRGIKNPVGRILAGIVSLYGIVGSYGITAFIGDVLSYCRLLALGLTTGIVGMTFNMLGGLVKDVPYVGIILFIIIVVVGHLFNFVISLLGAFVHSMRLIFVEFFGRFYDSDAQPFQALGFNSPLCTIKKKEDFGK